MNLTISHAAADLPTLTDIHRQAFNGPAEALLVELLVRAQKDIVSLMASVDGEIVGHILFSPVSLTPHNKAFNALGLAPVAVLPAHQNRGIGSALIRAGLDACRSSGYTAVVVLGNPAYYMRFGFQRAQNFGLGNEYGVDDEFMALALTKDGLSGMQGTVKYAPEFQEASC